MPPHGLNGNQQRASEPVTTSEVWRALLGGPAIPRPISDPAPGYYRTKLRRGGPWVAARIWTADGHRYCVVNGKAEMPEKVWPYLHAITPEAYEELRHKNETDPKYDPFSAVDLTKEISTP